jgi:preprotein translocase subunit SecB
MKNTLKGQMNRMANAALVNQKVQEVHMVNRLEAPGQIQLDSSFSLNVSFAPNGDRCVGKLTQTLRDKETAGSKFTLSVELLGIFNCSGATTDEMKRQIHGEVYDQLFPHIQAQCSTLAAASGIPGLMLRKGVIEPGSISVNRGSQPPTDRNPDGGPKLTLL